MSGSRYAWPRLLRTTGRLFDSSYQEYLARGYCADHPSKMQYHYHSLLPDARTFLLEKSGKLLGTISVILDSPCGLPMETLFPEEITRLRRLDRTPAEVVLLAIDLHALGMKRFALADYFKLTCVFRLFKLAFDYARFARVSDLVIAMHPRHGDLYHFLKFEAIGLVKPYPGAMGKPALPMRLDIPRAQEMTPTNRGVGSYFLKEFTPAEKFHPAHVWTRDELRRLLFEEQSLWSRLPPKCQSYFTQCYGFMKGG